MSWRTIVVSSQSKLDYKMGYLVIRGTDLVRIYLDEIAVLVVENPAVSFTGCLIEALTEKKIKVIFCDSKRNPVAELVPHHGSHDSSRKIRSQVAWNNETKALVWREIVIDKIEKQASLLMSRNHESEAVLLKSYMSQVEPADATNREGHAAKVYFNALFGLDFTRSSDSPINAAMNYGYSILLSAVNREVSANGYITQLGIFHDNMFNHFNLSCDIMEPFRPIVDKEVLKMELLDFSSEEKHVLWDVLNNTVIIDGCKQTLLNAIKIYTRSVFDAMNENDVGALKPYRLL